MKKGGLFVVAIIWLKAILVFLFLLLPEKKTKWQSNLPMQVLSVTEKVDNCSLLRGLPSSGLGLLPPYRQSRQVILKAVPQAKGIAVPTAALRARWPHRPALALLLPDPRFSSL